MQFSCLDQENTKLKLENWKAIDPESNHFFWPYLLKEKENCEPPQHQQQSGTPSGQTGETSGRFTGNDGIHCNLPTTDSSQYEQTLLWVHQTEWQKQLSRYGNTIILIDATYKTTQYDLALFFTCVCTNVGYSVVAGDLEGLESNMELTLLHVWLFWSRACSPWDCFSRSQSILMRLSSGAVMDAVCPIQKQKAYSPFSMLVRGYLHVMVM